MDEGAHFTIDFIEQQHRQPVQMLMEILCINMKQAYDLFLEAGCNAETAINLKTNPSPQKHQFQETIPRNTRGRGRRNAIMNDFIDDHEQYFEGDYGEEAWDEDYHSLPVARRRPPPLQVEEETQFDVKFNKLLEQNRKKKKSTFQSQYPIRRIITSQPDSMSNSQSIGMKIFGKKASKPQVKKILNIKPFFKDIEKGLVEKMITVKFGKGSMSQSLLQSLRMFQPLLAFHLNFDREQNHYSNTNTRNTKKLFRPKKMVIDITEEDDNPNLKMIEVDEVDKSNQRAFLKTDKNKFFKSLLINKKIENAANEGFLNYILDVESYDFEHYFKEYFQKSTRKQSYLLILRVNYLEKMEFVGKINLDEVIQKVKQKDEKQVEEQINSIVQQLKKISDKCKSIQKEQDQLNERLRLFNQGIYHYEYKKAPTTAEKMKIKQDRELIKQQQEEFLNMENEYIEQKIKELGDQKPQKQKISKEDIMQKRKNIRNGLKSYKQGDPHLMMIKFRLPSGKNIVLQVSSKEKVAYLFDFIFSHEMEDLGFEQEEEGGFCEREFDIIRPEDRISLQSKIDEVLEDFFEGSMMESLIVKEKN